MGIGIFDHLGIFDYLGIWANKDHLDIWAYGKKIKKKQKKRHMGKRGTVLRHVELGEVIKSR